MRHIEEYELFEALARPNTEAMKKRISDRFGRLTKHASLYPNSSSEKAKAWIKKQYGIDLGALLTELTAFATKASHEQIPNILNGVKGEDFARYVDGKVASILKDFTKRSFSAGPAKGKAGMIRAAYLISGKKGLAKDAFRDYKAKKLPEGAGELIGALTGFVYSLGAEISQASRLDPGASSDELPEMKGHSAAIRRWQDQYDSHFTNRDKILISYLDAVTTAIWES